MNVTSTYYLAVALKNVETLPGICHDSYETKLIWGAYLPALSDFLNVREFSLCTSILSHISFILKKKSYFWVSF